MSSKSGAMRWGRIVSRHLLQHGPDRRPADKEVPTVAEFSSRVLQDHVVTNRQKASGSLQRRRFFAFTVCR